MFAYSLADGLPSGNRVVWSRQPLQPVAAAPLTPFSYSVLEEVLRRAWYQYFDELGFTPLPRARVIRQHNGLPYLNLTISAQLDAEHAGVEPLALSINGERFALAKWEKPGFLASIKLGRNRKKIAAALAGYGAAMPAITQRAQSWSAKTKEVRWTQADVLQIMEEIERVGVESIKVFFAARHNLELVYNQLLWLTNAQAPDPANVALIGNALGDLTALIEYQIAEQFMALGTMARENAAVATWLAAGDFAEWSTALPDKQFTKAVETFLAHYGHRCVGEAEISTVRWDADHEFFFRCLHAQVQTAPKKPVPLPAAQQVQRLIDAAGGDAKLVQRLIEQARTCIQLQSQALHAFAYLLTGTRHWAYAAAGEAMADQRLTTTEDVFFFTLEEVKQMMTGEWNISDQQGIQRICQERRAAFATWQQSAQEGSPWLLIGDSVAQPINAGLPGAAGEAIGPLRHWNSANPARCNGAIVGTAQVDSGWSLILPLARALVVAQGTPLDPIVAAARARHLPTVTTLGIGFNKLVEGAQTTVHGDRGYVEQ